MTYHVFGGTLSLTQSISRSVAQSMIHLNARWIHVNVNAISIIVLYTASVVQISWRVKNNSWQQYYHYTNNINIDNSQFARRRSECMALGPVLYDTRHDVRIPRPHRKQYWTHTFS